MIGLTTFYFKLHSTDLTGRISRITNDLVDLYTILFKYHEFADIFSKAKAETLAPYYLYNLQIKLKNGKNLSIRTIYLLSTTKQEVLKEFISRDLNTRFIHLTSFSHRVSVLFIKKKMAFSIYILTFKNLTTLYVKG